jgi:hypothetical protein
LVTPITQDRVIFKINTFTQKTPRLGRFLVLQHLVLQPQIIRDHRNKFRIGGLSARVLDGVTEEGIDTLTRGCLKK